MAQEIKYDRNMAGNFRLLSYATGDYQRTCRCGVTYLGDKRSVTCLSCAIEYVDAKFDFPQQPQGAIPPEQTAPRAADVVQHRRK